MNLAEHLQRFYADLKQPDSNRYPLALVKSWLDESERIVNKESKTIRSSSVVASVSDQRLYDFPTDILDWQIRDVYYSTSDSAERKRLTPISIQKLDKLDRGWRARNGTPIYWYLDKEQSKWGLQPYEKSVTTGTECIEILYRAKHTKMTTHYITGTVTINNDETSVVGVSTAFIGNVLASDELGIGKLLDKTTAFPTIWHVVSADAVSDTALVLSVAFSQASVSAQNYIISSPSSIENDELNICSVLWAMGLAKGKDGDSAGRTALQNEALVRIRAEMNRLEEDAESEEPMIPEGAYPYPGGGGDDYS